MSVSNVRSALVQAFVAGAYFDAAHTAYENKKFTPPTSEAWCALTFMPAPEPLVATLGLHGRDRIEGFLQVDLNYPMGEGEGATLAKIDAIRNGFTVGTRFAYGGDEVVIRSCGRSQGRIVENYYRVSVSVYFYSDIQR